jgi:hypothetical protein
VSAVLNAGRPNTDQSIAIEEDLVGKGWEGTAAKDGRIIDSGEGQRGRDGLESTG